MDDQKLSLNWSNFQDNLISTFGDLRHDTDFVDVTLACEDQSLKAHQVALSACSPFFQVAKMTHSQICCCTFLLVSDDAEAKPSPAPPDLHEGDEELGSCLHP